MAKIPFLVFPGGYFIYEIAICWELAISAPQLAWHACSICYTQWFVKHENRRLEKHLTCKPSNNAQFKTLVQFKWVLLTLVCLSQTGKLVLQAQTIFCNINMFILAWTSMGICSQSQVATQKTWCIATVLLWKMCIDMHKKLLLVKYMVKLSTRCGYML